MQQDIPQVGREPSRKDELSELAGRIRGRLVRRGAPDYDVARKVYNAMIDRRPLAIARCVDVADVMACVRFARSRGMTVAVRGGGHNAAGLGVADDALVIDLSPMRGVRVDPASRLVRVEGGCTWGDVDHATHPFGLAVPSGILSTTGVGGLTLGGGTGHLTRKFGLTIDSLVSADVVLADGTLVTASERSHPDLFWAIRGGGGNFGVVTSFELVGHEVTDVIAGPMLWRADRAAELMRFYRELLPRAPEDLNGFFVFLNVPPAPPFPEELHGETMCGIFFCHLGTPEEVEADLAPARALGPALDGVGKVPYPVLQTTFDALYPPGLQWYWRADFVDELPNEAIEAHVRYGTHLPTPLSSMHLYPIDGAVHRVSPDATAFRVRDGMWSQVIVGVDPDPANAAIVRDWTRHYHDAVHPYSAGGAYVNFLMDEGHDRVEETYGEHYARLAEIKRAYDPDNFFHVNQNIHPARPASA